MPTTLNSGKIYVFISKQPCVAVRWAISGHILGPSLLQMRSIVPHRQGQTVAAYAALPPLRDRQPTFAQVVLLPSAWYRECFGVVPLDLSADNLEAEVEVFSRQPTSVLFVSSSKRNKHLAL